jgi:hypothetical protein
MKLPIARVVPLGPARRRAAWSKAPAALRPQDSLAGDPIEDCETACHRMHARGSAELAKCLQGCR